MSSISEENQRMIKTVDRSILRNIPNIFGLDGQAMHQRRKKAEL